VIRNLMALHQQGRDTETEQLMAQVYDLAMLSCQAFDRERMERFLERSHQLLAKIEPGDKAG
jgi:molecular chaperone HtpG